MNAVDSVLKKHPRRVVTPSSPFYRKFRRVRAISLGRL